MRDRGAHGPVPLLVLASRGASPDLEFGTVGSIAVSYIQAFGLAVQLDRTSVEHELLVGRAGAVL